MASTKIKNLPIKAPIGSMKIPTGGFGDYSITVNGFAEFIIDAFNIATTNYVDNIVADKEDRILTTGGNLSPVSQLTNVPDTNNDVIDEVAQALLDRIEYVKDNFGTAPSHNELLGRSATGAHPSTSISHKSGTVYTYLQSNENDINQIKNVDVPIIKQNILGKQDLIVNDTDLTTSPTFRDVPSTNNSSLNNSLQALVNRDGFMITIIQSGFTPSFDQDFIDTIGGYPLYSRLILDNGDIVQSIISNNTNNPNIDMTGWVKVNSASKILDNSGLTQQQWNNGVESIADLLAIPSPKDGSRVFVKSYHAGRKFGGDNFEYNSSRALENDGISVFNGWVRIFSVPYVTFYHGGAYGDYVTDDEVAIERSLKYARDNGKQVFVAGNFAKSKPFILRSNDYVVGSRLNSRIKKITNQTSGLPDILAPEKTDVYDTYDVDALCIFLPWSGYYADNIVLRDIMFVRGTYGVDTPSSYGLYAPRHSSCETLNLKFDNVLNGFLAKNLFLNKHTNFSSVGAIGSNGNVSVLGMSIYDGEDTPTGTSNTFERFLFVNYQQAYYISNLQTSEFTCCYGEAISKNKGFDETHVFYVDNPYELSFNQCGLENSYGTPMYITGHNPNIRSKVSITGWQSRWGANGTLTDHGLNLLTIAGSVDVTTDSASFVKGSEGFINNFAYITDGARLINLGSQLGSATPVVSNGAKLFDLYKSMYEGDGGLIKSTKDVGSDLNNGTEDSAGVVFKTVNGATLNIPSGASDIWGTSEYYGLNSSQGTQVLRATNLQKSYVRYRTGHSTFSAWVEK